MTDNKKLIKEFNNMLASSEKARKLVQSEIEKVDEKYRKLAEEEKKELNATADMLDSQIKYYKTILTPVCDGGCESCDDVGGNTEKVVDTLYSESAGEIPEPVEDETKDEPVVEVETKEPAIEAIPSDENLWPEETSDNNVGDTFESPSEDEDNNWPEFPEEWKN